MKPRAQIASMVAFLICLLTRLIVELFRDSIIINQSYAAWRTISTITMILSVLSGIWFIVSIVASIKRRVERKKKKEAAAASKLREEAANKSKRKLRTPEDVYEYYRNFLNRCEPNTIVHDEIRNVIALLDRMNDCQKRLEQLLEANDLEALGEPIRQIIQEIEDLICTKYKQAINDYIATNNIDVFIRACQEADRKNSDSIGRVEECLKTMATYANSRTDDGKDAEQTLNVCIEQLRGSARIGG